MNKRWSVKRLFLISLALLLPLVLVLTGCSTGTDQGNKKQLTKVRIGLSPFQDTLLPIIGKEKGWFEAEGLDVEFQTLSWNSIMNSVAANNIDVAVYNTTGVVSTYNKSPNVVFWYPWNIFTQGTALMGRPNIGLKDVKYFESQGKSHKDAVRATIQQLKGKTIVTTMGTDMGKAVKEATENNGLKSTDYKIIDMDTDQGLAAFLSGTGDMYLGGIPQRTRLDKEGYTTLATGSDLSSVPINGWVTTDKYANENEETLLKLQHVMFKIIRYTDKNQAEVAKTITDKLNTETGSKMTTQEFTRFWNEIEDYPLNAAQVDRDILKSDGFAYWKKTWDSDNNYFVQVDKSIPKTVPYSPFWVEKVQEKYIKKYGANEK